MVRIGAIKNYFTPTSSYRPFSLLVQQVHWKAIAIIAMVGLIFSASIYYLLKSQRLPTPPSISTTPANPTSFKEIRKKICQRKIEALLTPGEKLGNAIDTGDCFYDALAQTLQKTGITVTLQQLRQDIAEALKNPEVSSTLQKSIEDDPRGIESFEAYKTYVLYLGEELDTLRTTDPQAPQAPYWGNPSREGVILCQRYGFNLRIVSAGVIDSFIDSDQKLRLYRSKRKEINDENDISYTSYSGLIHERLGQLYQDESIYFSGEESYPPNTTYPKTCTLALYEDHFRPVL